MRFLAVSGFAAAVNFSARIGLSLVFSLPLSVVLAYIIGMITAFLLNKRLVFRPRQGRGLSRFFLFSLVNVVAILQTLAVTLLLARYVLPAIRFTVYPEELAHLIGIGVPVFTSYLGHKFITFSNKKGADLA